MGRRMTSYTDIGGGGAKWLDSWKEEGLIKLWLHRDPGWERRVHSFRKVEIEETNAGPTKKVKWLPFVCMESDDFHRARGKKDGKKPTPKICPGCRLIHELEMADELPEDEVIFEFVASRRDTRSLERGDIIGEKRHSQSYKDDLSAKTEFLIYVIDPADPTAVKILNEGWGFAKTLKGRIQSDVKALGDEDGNPQRSPICYLFEYDKGPPVKYSVSRFPEEKLTREIEDLWEGEPPDAEGFCTPGDPTPFYRAACDSITEKADGVINLDEIFEPAMLWWQKEKKSKGGGEEDTSFDTEDMDKERSSRSRTTDKPAEPEERPRRSRTEEKESEPEERPRRSRTEDKPAESEERPRRSRTEEKESEPEEKPTRRARRSVEDEQPPKTETKRSMGDEMGVETFACPDCGSDWEISSHDKCPSCGCPRSRVKGAAGGEATKAADEEGGGRRTRTRKF